MSFNCDKCSKFTAPGVPINKVVIETRHKVYEKIYRDKNGFVHTKRFEGKEIVKELNLCPICFTIVTGEQPNEGQKQNIRRNDGRSYGKRKDVIGRKRRGNSRWSKTQRSSTGR